MLIVFDDMIADMESNKKLSPEVTEVFLSGRKLNISLVFILQSYFKVPKTIRLNATHYFIMKIPNKRELQQIASNHFSDIDFKDFMKLYKEYTKEPYSFLVNNTTLHQINHYDLGRTCYKMGLSEKIQALNNKVKQKKVQYDLERRAAKISALSSENVSEYEFLSGKDVLPEKKLARKDCSNQKI